MYIPCENVPKATLMDEEFNKYQENYQSILKQPEEAYWRYILRNANKIFPV